jgi:hypothetical protein
MTMKNQEQQDAAAAYQLKLSQQYEAALTKMWRDIEMNLPKCAVLVKSDHPMHCKIESTTGESLGGIELDKVSSYYGTRGYRLPDTYVLTSKRIPNKTQWRDGGTRRYKKAESLYAAMAKFCKPENKAEAEYKRIDKQLDNRSYRINQRRSNIKPDRYHVMQTVEKMASKDMDERDQGRNDMDLIVYQQMRLDTYNRRAGRITSELWDQKHAAGELIK